MTSSRPGGTVCAPHPSPPGGRPSTLPEALCPRTTRRCHCAATGGSPGDNLGTSGCRLEKRNHERFHVQQSLWCDDDDDDDGDDGDEEQEQDHNNDEEDDDGELVMTMKMMTTTMVIMMVMMV